MRLLSIHNISADKLHLSDACMYPENMRADT